MRLRRAMFALLAIPLLDALGLVLVADLIGWQATVLLVVLTGLVGLLFVRAEGRHTLRSIERDFGAGEIPTDSLLDGAFILVAGAFLLTPGLVTDTLGFLFVVPVTRYPIREAVKRWILVPYLDERTDGLVTGVAWGGGFPDRGTYIDIEDDE